MLIFLMKAWVVIETDNEDLSSAIEVMIFTEASSFSLKAIMFQKNHPGYRT